MSADPQLAAARARAIAARARLDASLARAKAKLSPSSLANDAVSGAKAKAGELASGSADAVRQHPERAAIAAAAVGLLMARGPIVRAIRRWTANDDATAAEPASLEEPTPPGAQ